MYPYSLFSKNQDAEIVIAVKVRRIQKFHSNLMDFILQSLYLLLVTIGGFALTRNSVTNTLCVGPLRVLDSSK